MNPKYLAKIAEDQKVALEDAVKGLAEVVETLERLERKVDALMKVQETSARIEGKVDVLARLKAVQSKE